MDFFTAYSRPVKDYFEDCPDSETETHGYIPTERLIQSFEEAGIRLEVSRAFDFPGEDEVPDDYVPTVFKSRLDALMLDKDIKERLIAHLAKVKAEHGIEDNEEVEEEEAVDGSS